jgi:LmbE family N-acetylglucosaminyl deacetylase
MHRQRHVPLVRPWRRTALVGAAVLAVAALGAPASAADAEVQIAGKHRSPADLDVLYVGAHPDDEAGRLSMFGEWRERYGTRTGVVTVTRGEGGGNAVGPEEGPALGLLREHEERDAVANANITDVYNLDKVDSYYSVSEPLYREIWGHEDTLARLVRVVRQTKPEIIATMNTAPSPGNHGAHQEAALLAVEAYNLAGDPSAYPGQIRDEGLEPWTASKLLTTSARGSGASTGEACTTTFKPTDPTDDIYGVWSGRTSEQLGKTWAQVEREAQRVYKSQGWAGFPDVPADPEMLGCDYMTQIDSRVPFTRGGLTAAASSSSTMLQGALLPTPDGLPVGTNLEVSASTFAVVPGGSSTISVKLTAPADKRLSDVNLTIGVPDGWSGADEVHIGNVPAGATRTTSLKVTAPADASTNTRVLVDVDVRSGSLRGYGNQQLEVAPAVSGTQQLLPQVASFSSWASDNGVPQLRGTVKPVLTLPSGGSREVRVDLANNSGTAQSGSVSLKLPNGFSADAASKSYDGLAAGEKSSVTFTVTNDDDSLPTSNQGGSGGDYDYTIETTSDGGSATSAAALELVPTTAIEDAAPKVDGVIDSGEYGSSSINLSRVWEGSACTSAADCSAVGHVARNGDDLYVAAEVTDEQMGTLLAGSDCKRHWRTDSVEIAIDPKGTSENTSTTFKMFVLPATADGGEACAGRDADNNQGPIAETAPSVTFAAKVNAAGDGYVVETKIPAAELPDTVDPEHLGVNVFVYDSDTQDKTGQTRIGWSTWGGVQGDPYRWGVVTTPGWAPPSVATKKPTIPDEALASVDSPLSIAQAVRTGVPLAGGPAADPRRSAVVREATQSGSTVIASLDVKGNGAASLFAVDADGNSVGKVKVDLTRGDRNVSLPVTGSAVRIVMAYAADSGGTTSSAAPIRR